MKDLKLQIGDTVFLPDFVREWNAPGDTKDRLSHILFEILNFYYCGVTNYFLSNRKIKDTCYEIDELSFEITEITTPHINLQCWLFIGETVEKWIEFALNEEEYETASNLKKILNSEYV
jgi:hypothetical protein